MSRYKCKDPDNLYANSANKFQQRVKCLTNRVKSPKLMQCVRRRRAAARAYRQPLAHGKQRAELRGLRGMNILRRWSASSRRAVALRRRGAARRLLGVAILLLACLSLARPAQAAAECPDFYLTLQRGSTFTLNASACDHASVGIGPVVTSPTNGTLNTSDLSEDEISYTNNGSTATQDSFAFNDENGQPVTVHITIVVISLTPTTLPAGALTSAYTPTTLTATGGTAPYLYTVSSGGTPPGMTVSGGGVLSGTPTATGTFNFTVRATDSGPNNANANGPFYGSQAYTVVINGPPLSMAPSSLTNAQVGTPYGNNINASGGTAPYTYSISAGTLPAGLNLNSSSGALSGTPTAGGSFNFTVSAHDSAGSSGSIAYTLVVNPPTLGLIPATLNPATQNNSYTQTITAVGGTAPYLFSVTAGTLPTGLSLNPSSGVLSGTPTGHGTFNFQVSATDHSSGTGPYTVSANYSLVIAAAAPSIATASLTPGTVGAAYSQTINGSGGNPPYSFAVTSGTLPAGLSLASTGVLNGTPTAGGSSFPITVTLTDAAGSTATQSYILVTNAATITVGPATLPGGSAGVAYAQNLSGSGGTAPYSYAVTAGVLPAGMSLSSSGNLSGVPTAVGPANFTVTAQDHSTGSGPYTGSRNYSINIAAPTLSLTPGSGALNAGYGQAFSQSFAASGGVAPYAFRETGPLPNGVSWNPSTGTLSGTPVQSGNFPISITATDQSTGTGAPYSVTNSYTLSVTAPTIVLAPTAIPPAAVGTAYSTTLTANGGIGPYNYTVTAGSLPAGLSLAPTGTLSGTPTAAGNFNITVTASDMHGATGSQAYVLTVAAPTIALNPASLPDASAEAAYTQSLSASGGTAPYNFTVTSGALPPGLSLSSDGSLSGTPTAAGAYAFAVRVADSSSGIGSPFSTTRNYNLQVDAPVIAITPAALPAMQIAAPFSQQLSASGGNGSYTFSASGNLPPGLSLSPSGLLAGTPNSAGTFNFTVTAKDGLNYSGNQTYSVTIGAPTLAITPANLPAATAEAAYSQTIVASGGTAPYTYAISAGALPAGLSINATSGVLSGTPTAAGNFNFNVRATDSSTGTGAPYSVSRSYSLTVNVPAISITPATLPAVQVAAAFSQQLTAAGGNGSYTFSVSSGSLPTGVSLSPSGLLAGTPTTAGNFNVTVMAKDSLNFSGSQAYTLSVGAPALSLTPGSLPAATAETSYTQSFTASGGVAPYGYTVSTGALPAGLSLDASTGALSGTPTVSGNFNFSVRATDSSTGTGAPFSVTHAYTLAVNAPGITLTPASLPNAQDGVAYSQSITASGGNGSYSYSISAGALPSGLSLSTAGQLAGTPSSAGNFNFSVSAKDGLGFTGSQAYTLVVAQPKPIAVNDSASTAANSPVTIPVTSNDSGPITSIAIGQAPSHGSAAVNGLNVVYTPNQNYFGSDSFTYTATGPGGTSAAATVSVTVNALAVPTVVAQTATTLAAKAVTIHAATGATGGPFTAANVVTPPSAGSISIAGTDIVFTPAANASGAVAFDYTLSNAFGTSLPGKITVTVNPLPVPPATLSANAIAGVPVVVDLTQGASGGPFTAATLVSVVPANAGSASISGSGGDYQLHYVPGPTSSGAVTISFTLSNAYATSVPGTVNVNITARSDPSHDPEVIGVLDAQADATRRFATAQIDNFQQRLETLHQQGSGGGFSNGLSFSSASMQRQNAQQGALAQTGGIDDPNRRYLVQPDPNDSAHGSSGNGNGSGANGGGSDASAPGLALWSGGAVNFGSSDANASVRGLDFTTSGVTFGGDYRLSPAFALGAGVGYGHDDTDVGNHGSRSTADSYTAAFYASYHPGAAYVDGLVGYQWLSFDSLRYVTDDGNRVSGSRNGDQFFASLSAGYDYRHDKLLITPYGRLDLAHATLDAYTEHGDAIYALDYRNQTVKTTTTSLGVHLDYQTETGYGSFAPHLRLEYQHDFQGAGQATMSYADLLGGPLYRATLNQWGQDRGLIGIGASLQTPNLWTLRAEYEYLFGSGTQQTQSILLNVSKKF